MVTIDPDNRGVKTTDPAQPGLDPICKQRIVLIGGIDIELHPGGALYVTIDPRQWFTLGTESILASLPLSTDPACASAIPYGDPPSRSIHSSITGRRRARASGRAACARRARSSIQ